MSRPCCRGREKTVWRAGSSVTQRMPTPARRQRAHGLVASVLSRRARQREQAFLEEQSAHVLCQHGAQLLVVRPCKAIDLWHGPAAGPKLEVARTRAAFHHRLAQGGAHGEQVQVLAAIVCMAPEVDQSIAAERKSKLLMRLPERTGHRGFASVDESLGKIPVVAAGGVADEQLVSLIDDKEAAGELDACHVFSAPVQKQPSVPTETRPDTRFSRSLYD